MANVQVDPAALNPRALESNRQVIRDGNNFVYVFVNNNGNIRAYKGNVAGEPTSFTEQDAVGAPDAAGVNDVGVAAAIDSTGLVHVIWYHLPTGRGTTERIRYGQFRTSAHAITQDDWVLIEEQVSTLEANFNLIFTKLLGVIIDANDDPHVAWNDDILDAGNRAMTIFYANRIGGSWNARVEIQRVGTAIQDIIVGMEIMIADPASSVNADRPIIAISSIDVGDETINVFHGTVLNATAFTEAPDVTGAIISFPSTSLGRISIAIDSNEKITIPFIEDVSRDFYIVEHLNSKPWGTWEAPILIDNLKNYLNPSIAIDGIKRFIFISDGGNNINLWKDEGPGFVEETADPDLPNVGDPNAFRHQICKWASKNNNSPKSLDYVFEDDDTTVIFYNTVTFPAQEQIDLGDMVVTDSIDLGDMVLVDSIDSNDMVLIDASDFGDMVLVKSIDFGDNTLNKSIDLGDMVTGD